MFLVFAAPALVMSTSYCMTHSGASTSGSELTGAGGDVDLGGDVELGSATLAYVVPT